MKNLKAKLRRDGGFTLVEMLIVVAIVAILIAISIPTVGNALEEARKATDAANERAAKGEIMIMYLSGVEIATGVKVEDGKYYNYDAASGKIVNTAITATYGKNTTIADTGKGKFISVGVKDGVAYVSWDQNTWYEGGPVSASVNGTTATKATVTFTSGIAT